MADQGILQPVENSGLKIALASLGGGLLCLLGCACFWMYSRRSSVPSASTEELESRLGLLEEATEERDSKLKAVMRQGEQELEEWHRKLRSALGRLDKREALQASKAGEAEDGAVAAPAESDVAMLNRVFG